MKGASISIDPQVIVSRHSTTDMWGFGQQTKSQDFVMLLLSHALSVEACSDATSLGPRMCNMASLLRDKNGLPAPATYLLPQMRPLPRLSRATLHRIAKWAFPKIGGSPVIPQIPSTQIPDMAAMEEFASAARCHWLHSCAGPIGEEPTVAYHSELSGGFLFVNATVGGSLL